MTIANLWLPSIAGSSSSSPVVVQSAHSASGSTGSVSLTGVTVNNYLIYAPGGNGPGPETVTTTAGSTSAWTQSMQENFGSQANCGIYIAKALSTSVTVATTLLGGAGQAGILEVSNINPTADNTIGTSSNTPGPMEAAAMTPGNAGDLAVAVVGTIANGPSVPSGWTGVGTVGLYGLLAYLVPSGGAAIRPSFGASGTGSWCVSVATFVHA
jgi:hypothetical protein